MGIHGSIFDEDDHGHASTVRRGRDSTGFSSAHLQHGRRGGVSLPVRRRCDLTTTWQQTSVLLRNRKGVRACRCGVDCEVLTRLCKGSSTYGATMTTDCPDYCNRF